MAVRLGHNQYGKAETRMVRVTRDGAPHPHAFERAGGGRRTATVVADPGPAWDLYPML